MQQDVPYSVALILSGGVGLGAYQAGAYAALSEDAKWHPDWLAASSSGAANAAIIAGSPVKERVGRLDAFWRAGDPWHDVLAAYPLSGPLRELQNWAAVASSRLVGTPGHFSPRFWSALLQPYSSLYDLSPLRERLARLVDFGRLNSGEIRVAVAMTDIESGEAVVFDTGRGDRIGVDHLLASAGFVPEFAPVELGGRLLGDGGLAANAPLEAVFLAQDHRDTPRIGFVVDLFARDGGRPRTLADAFARKNDLLFANQTALRLEGLQRESALAARLRRVSSTTLPRPWSGNHVAAVIHLAYRAPPEEAGGEKIFDFSAATLRDRWHAGALDMAEALTRCESLDLPEDGFAVVPIRRMSV